MNHNKQHFVRVWDRVMSGYRGWCSILWSTASNRCPPIGWLGYWDAAQLWRHPTSITFLSLAGSPPAPGNVACVHSVEYSGAKEIEDWTKVKLRQKACCPHPKRIMREIVHIQAGQCGNQIGAKVGYPITELVLFSYSIWKNWKKVIRQSV